MSEQRKEDPDYTDPPTPDEVWSVARKIGEWAEECDFDHHGYCQTHFMAEPPCPFGVLRAWVNWP